MAGKDFAQREDAGYAERQQKAGRGREGEETAEEDSHKVREGTEDKTKTEQRKRC